MKKLMTALFVLSAMTTFAETANPNSVDKTVKVTATIKSASTIVIKDGSDLLDEITVAHGEIDKGQITTAEDGGDHLKAQKTVSIERASGDNLLFNSNETIKISLPTKAKLTSTTTGDQIGTTLSYTVGTIVNGTSAPLTITSRLNKSDVLKAKKGNDYSVSGIALNITIGAPTGNN